ncbi:MAG: outer membrane lipoprotein carrier protein LolA [Firmicutes bacterium]|nr:outer membrane lipoprotein carrier protein LolA [Bacillota bacterium]
MIVYVLTPSLNKSFKFQSEWPYNNSQSYLLQSILKDITDDDERKFEETNDGYIYTTNVNYSNNPDLISQEIFFDKNLNIKKVEVMDKNEQTQIKMEFNDIDLKATYADNYFDLKENVNVSSAEETETPVSKIEDIIYPMYIPKNTSLTSQDTVSTTNGERVILTFSGDKPFMLVQETIAKTDDIVTIPVDGEPILFADTIGAKTDGSITWLSNGLEYYLVSDILTETELVSVAKSISALPVVK